MSEKRNVFKGNVFKESAAKPAEPQRATQKKAKPRSKKSIIRPRQSNPKLKKVVGTFFLLAALYLFLAFFSFFLNWFQEKTDDYYADIPIELLSTTDYAPVHNWGGNLGAMAAQLLIKEGFGIGAFYIPFLLFVLAMPLMFGRRIIKAWGIWKYAIMLLAWVPLFMGLLFKSHPLNVLGGAVGVFLNTHLYALVGQMGIIISLIFILMAYLILTFSLTLTFKRKKKDSVAVKQSVRNSAATDKYNIQEYALHDQDDGSDIFDSVSDKGKPLDEDNLKDAINLEIDLPEKPVTVAVEPDKPDSDIPLDVEPVVSEKIKVKGAIEKQGLDTSFDPRLDLPDYQFPPLDLLDMYGDGSIHVDRAELEANKNRIVETLGNYAIGIDKIKATPGPTVTLYEIVPSPGIRISRIKSLEDDIALSLSAIGIRIIAPIPGKGTVGIEVPNQKPEIVSMRSIIGSEKFRANKFELPFGLGKTIANESYVADLTRMPHILMAGATGQGKSVGLNAIITSLLYCKHPAELKFVLVDPKKVELSLFNKIERHYLAKLPDSESAIITDTRKVVRTLNSLGIEMDNRYELLKDAQVRNIKEYNEKFKSRRLNPNEGHRFLPYIVLVVDEFADLIMTAGKEVEGPITRLAQLARAVGIHLIIATQRPSVNIITGTIKANFPARMAFRVISRIDSRTILDTGGADQLVGRGDMLFSTGNDLIRLQCAFVDTPEVERLTDFIGSQRGYPDAFHLPEYLDEQDEIAESYDASERDELFEDAARLIVQNQQGSTSLLQRRLKLGYNRAGRIIDQLEAAGIVGPFEGSKAREVKVANEMALEQFLRDLDAKAKFDT